LVQEDGDGEIVLILLILIKDGVIIMVYQMELSQKIFMHKEEMKILLEEMKTLLEKMKMHLEKMKMHLEKMKMHLEKMKMLFKNIQQILREKLKKSHEVHWEPEEKK